MPAGILAKSKTNPRNIVEGTFYARKKIKTDED